MSDSEACRRIEAEAALEIRLRLILGPDAGLARSANRELSEMAPHEMRLVGGVVPLGGRSLEGFTGVIRPIGR